MQNGGAAQFFMGLGLKSDGHHGNGGTLINGNGGTHDHLSKFRQPSLHYIPVVCINLYNIFWKCSVEHFFTGFKGFIFT